jgi:hypothetical protein
MVLIKFFKQGLLQPGLVVITLFFNLACLPMASLADKGVSSEQRLALLDIEITLLRTEIALRNGERGRFLINMHELSMQPIPPQFQARFDVLNQQRERLELMQVEQSLFRSALTARDVVVLLPLSSEISEVSRVMHQVFEAAFTGRRIHLIDTDIYTDMVELFNLVKMFNPGLVIGPLERQKADAFYALNPQIPAISFTSLANHQPNVRALASTSYSQTHYLKSLLERVDVSHIAWLTDRTEQANQFMQEIETLYQQRGLAKELIQRFYIDQGVDQSVAAMLGIEQSSVRQNWLQTTIGQRLESQPYVRKDKQLIIGVMRQTPAQQVKPLLNFHQLEAPFLWLPTQVPSLESFKSSQASWQQTYALFPAHLTQHVININNNDVQNSEVGLFHALANALVNLVETAEQPLPYTINTQMGEMTVNSIGHYQFLPSLMLLDKGKLTGVALEEFYTSP